MLGKLVMKMESMVRAQGMMYNAVMQSVLLYGRETWVVMGDIMKVREGFHPWVSKRVTGMTARCTTSGEWEWTLVAKVLVTDGLWPTKEYIQRRQVAVAAQVAYRPIYEMFTWT